MDESTFWKVIADAHRLDSIEHSEALKERLGELKWFEVLGFQVQFDAAVAAADTPELRGASALVSGSRTPESFRDFRAWLVGQGRPIYAQALNDPDSLADVLDGDPVDGFGLNTAALRVYEAKTGMSDFYARLEEAKKDARAPAAVPAGAEFGTEEALRARFPRLCEMYLLPARESDEIVEGGW
jgi:hypothetical protein